MTRDAIDNSWDASNVLPVPQPKKLFYEQPSKNGCMTTKPEAIRTDRIVSNLEKQKKNLPKGNTNGEKNNSTA